MTYRLLGWAALILSTSAQADQQQPPSSSPVNGGTSGGLSAQDRVWYPKTDVVKPDEILGAVFVVSEDKTMHILLQPPMKNGYKPTVEILKADPSYQFSRTKGDSAGASVPIIALTAKIEDKETQSGTVVDVAHATIPGAQQYQFCELWPNLRTKWNWKAGDQVFYIFRASISTVSWKIGKEHEKDAGFSIGNYFSANGKQYDEESTSAVVSAMSYDTIDSQVTKDALNGRCVTHHLYSAKVRTSHVQPLSVRREK